MRIYLDAAPTIYLFEGTSALKRKVREKLEGTKTGDDIIVSSEISRIECRVKPMMDGDQDLLDLYDAFFSSIEVIIITPDRAIWERATLLRVKYGFRIPDALHLACAIESECDLFLTNDHRLQRCTEIDVEVVE